MMMFSWFKKQDKPIEEEEWHFIPCSSVDIESFLRFSDTQKFLRENFEIGSWKEIRQQEGFYSIVSGYQFKNKEDAALFKLTFCK